MKPTRKLTPPQALIEKFVLNQFKSGKGFWPKEIKIAKKLIDKYNFEFLNWVYVPFGYQVMSLAYFLSKNGEDYLGEKYMAYLKTQIKESKKPQQVAANDPIIGQDISINKNPTSIQEFLKV